MEKIEFIEAIRPVIKVFDELGILYYIGGSIASSAYGISRTTLDVDMVVNLIPSQISQLVSRLKNEYYIDEEMISDAIKMRSSFNIMHLKTMLKIDIFTLKDKPYSQAEFNRKRNDNFQLDPDSINIFLCSPEDIILNKLEWFKAGGGASERQWNDILGVIKVQGDNLDKEYLKNWAQRLEIINLLVKAFSECEMLL